MVCAKLSHFLFFQIVLIRCLNFDIKTVVFVQDKVVEVLDEELFIISILLLTDHGLNLLNIDFLTLCIDKIEDFN
jgi:hypothetical protein